MEMSACTKTPDRTAFERQSSANMNAHDLVSALCRFADRLCGPTPTVNSAQTLRSVEGGDGFVGDVRREAELLSDHLADGWQAMRRIEAAFPGFDQPGPCEASAGAISRPR